MIDTTAAPRPTAYSTVRTVQETDSSTGTYGAPSSTNTRRSTLRLAEEVSGAVESSEIEALVELLRGNGMHRLQSDGDLEASREQLRKGERARPDRVRRATRPSRRRTARRVVAIAGRSSSGTARRSKKLLALYSLSRSGSGGPSEFKHALNLRWRARRLASARSSSTSTGRRTNR